MTIEKCNTILWHNFVTVELASFIITLLHMEGREWIALVYPLSCTLNKILNWDNIKSNLYANLWIGTLNLRRPKKINKTFLLYEGGDCDSNTSP